MGISLDFFPRQTIVSAGSTGNAEYYSNPVCVRRFESMVLEFRVFGLIGTDPGVGLSLETAAELTVLDSIPSPWREFYVFPTIAAAPHLLRTGLSLTTASRYLRARVLIQTSDVALTFSFIAAARGN